MKYWLFAVLAGCAATPAMAETCVLTAQPGASARVSYDPFAGAPTEAEVVIIVRNSGAEACQAEREDDQQQRAAVRRWRARQKA